MARFVTLMLVVVCFITATTAFGQQVATPPAQPAPQFQTAETLPQLLYAGWYMGVSDWRFVGPGYLATTHVVRDGYGNQTNECVYLHDGVEYLVGEGWDAQWDRPNSNMMFLSWDGVGTWAVYGWSSQEGGWHIVPGTESIAPQRVLWNGGPLEYMWDRFNADTCRTELWRKQIYKSPECILSVPGPWSISDAVMVMNDAVVLLGDGVTILRLVKKEGWAPHQLAYDGPPAWGLSYLTWGTSVNYLVAPSNRVSACWRTDTWQQSTIDLGVTPNSSRMTAASKDGSHYLYITGEDRIGRRGIFKPKMRLPWN